MAAQKEGPKNFFLSTDAAKTKSNAIEVPSIRLPKGGGALKGIDEKFTVNSVNGTASFSILLPFSKARGATPALSLSYNSGAGNGMFGLGWNMSLSAVRRKTDNALPKYFDAIDSDVYLFSEAEDLVPAFKKAADGTFSIDTGGSYIIDEKLSPDNQFTIRFYRPRLEGLFARIERWTDNTHGTIKWRVVSKENVTTLFGWSENARITDPQDSKKIFEWFPEFVFDDKGNCSRYIYKKEDPLGADKSLLHNRNRLKAGAITYTNLYPEKIYYGNKTPYKKFGDAFPSLNDFLFSTAFDYGEYDSNAPYDKIQDWDFRQDPFSDYKAGFEIRTTRLCKRILFFHHFTGPDEYDGLVRSLNFKYDTSTEQDFTFLKSVTSHGYIKKQNNSYASRHLPAMEFDYEKHNWNKQVKNISGEALIHAPVGLDEQQYQFTDLFNEGLSGILTEQGNGWYYKHNFGDGKFDHAKLVSPKPSFVGLGGQLQFADLDGDGGKQLVSYEAEPRGYFELNDENEWEPFRCFIDLPGIPFGDANTRMLDLDGDGKPEIVISDDEVFTWYPSEGRNGYSPAQKTVKPFDEEDGPRIVFSEATQSIYLADMSGDGMTDILRIRNGEVCYWPNLGYGKFGAKVSLDHAPIFDHADHFDTSFIRLADIDGSGTTDIIYLGKNKFSCWKNLSGNQFSTTPFEIDSFPEIHSQSKITVTDLLGNGVACIVWSSPLSKDTNTPLKYIDLMNGKKPHIMVAYRNNLGKEVSFEYTPSTKFYIQDKLAGKPWITKLHFPVHCISKSITKDKVSGMSLVSEYKYHHGYYDHVEKEFRGFGMVEQTDAETFERWKIGNASNIVEESLHQEPVVSKSWYHTGAFLQKENILNQFAGDYWHAEMQRRGFPAAHPEVALPDARLIATPGILPALLDQLSGDEWQEASRACKGLALRTEVFARDAIKSGNTTQAQKNELTPYSVTSQNCLIELLQPKGKNKYAVFIARQSEAITYSYERNPEDPRISHNINLKLDEHGNVLESANIVYPRLIVDLSLPEETQQEQKKTVIIYTQNEFTNDVKDDNQYRLRLPSQIRTFALKGVGKTLPYYSPGDFIDILSDVKSDSAPYHEIDKAPAADKAQKRLIEHVRILYSKNDLTGASPLHQLESLAIPFESYQLAYTPELLSDIFGSRVNGGLLTEGKFTNNQGDNNWWIRSGTTQFKSGTENHTHAQDRFYVPVSYTDAYGALTKLAYYGDHFLLIAETVDALGNKSKVESFNFRTLSPRRMKDINGNLTEAVSDELGLVKAVAVMGKGSQADELTGIDEITENEDADLNAFFQKANASGICNSQDLNNVAKVLLKRASLRFAYDFNSYRTGGKPAVVASITRETHYRTPDGSLNQPSKLQLLFEYSSGMGEALMKKTQAEPGKAKQFNITPDADTTPFLRWIGDGRVIRNNKGNTVKQYEPYFSASPKFEDEKELVEAGVTPVMYYDAAGRLVKTVLPDETFSKVTFDSWKQTVYDANDTVLDSPWYNDRKNRLIDVKLAADEKDPVREQLAAENAGKHANTPNTFHLDTLGRPVLSIEHNKKLITGVDEFYHTKVKLDNEGNLRVVTDARGNSLMKYKYDMLGNLVYQNSMDAGQRWLLINILGNPLRTWDERDHEFQYSYDILHRPTESKVINNVGQNGDQILDHLFDRIIYGESILLADDSNRLTLQNRNVFGRIINHYDTGGLIDTPDYNFQGQPIATNRKLFKKYKEVPNWVDANLSSDLEPGNGFTFTTETDALDRITKQTTPDGNVITRSFNEAGDLDKESILHPGTSVDTLYIKQIEYNEKRQRKRIVYGNNVSTKFEYDRETFRLRKLQSKRQNGDPLQEWHYTYDPMGNITHINDKNIPVVYFNNQKVEGVSSYTYDALYRLREATGRENDASLAFGTCDNWNDLPFGHIMNPGQPMAVRNYTQSYQYDSVGNITQMKHVAAAGSWTRTYAYEAGNNRLKSTSIGDNSSPAHYTKYKHHTKHGYLEELPHLEKIVWNFKEEVVMSTRQHCTDDNIPVITYYQYDGRGQRLRKITENQATAGAAPSKKDERIYLECYELYKKHSGTQTGLERESLSLMGEGHRFVIVETRNNVDDGTEKLLVRYQLHNHLGSAALELDGSASAQIISYEEYHPFGTTAYQAKNSAIKSAAKRYKYAGMERDDETGMEYHSARYYLPWLGRWISSDPLDRKHREPNREENVKEQQNDPEVHELPADDTSESDPKPINPSGEKRINTYCYSHNNPIVFFDTDGESPISIILKQAAKVGLKKALKEYIKSTIKAKIKDYVGKKVLSKAFAKQLAKDADDVISLLDSEWWEFAIELVPIAGDAYGAVSLGKKGKAAWDKISAIEKRLERVAQWTGRWGEAGAKKIDDVIEQRHKIRQNSNASETLIQAHHVIPVEVLKKNEVAQAAVIAGFDFNSKANTWLVKRSEHLAGHKELNDLLSERLEDWAKKNPGFTPAQAREFLEKEVVPEWQRNFVEAVTY